MRNTMLFSLFIFVLSISLVSITGCNCGTKTANPVNPKDSAPLIWIPAAIFTMGTPSGVGNLDEHPTRQVTLDGFWIYKNEVTVLQYRAFCQATGRALPHFPQPITDSGQPSNYSWAGKTGWDDPSLQLHPIVNVSWEDAKAYAVWAGASLPTEAQWEYASRGKKGNNFPWGGSVTASDLYNGWDENKCANAVNSRTVNISTWPVGSFSNGASWCGANDMAGNVWEWTADWYADYEPGPATNPDGPATGNRRSIRGGSWFESNNFVYRGTARFYATPASNWEILGFRCVMNQNQ